MFSFSCTNKNTLIFLFHFWAKKKKHSSLKHTSKQLMHCKGQLSKDNEIEKLALYLIT